MSFSLAALYRDKVLLGSDRMIIDEGGHPIADGGSKIFKLKNDIFVAITGNGNVRASMLACVAGLLDTGSAAIFEKRLRTFKERFDPVYRTIPEDYLKIAKGSAQLIGIGMVEKKLIGFTINYVPCEGNFDVEILDRPGLIASNADGNSLLERFFPTMIKWTLSVGQLIRDGEMTKVFGRIYRVLSRVDDTVSALGDLVILRPDGKSVELVF